MKDNLDLNKLLKPEQAADMLSLTLKGLKKLRQAGEGPDVVEIGPRRFRYRYGDIVAYIEKNTIRNSA